MIGNLFYEKISDIGSVREKNQDDCLIKHLKTEGYEVFIAAVADGVGSFNQSELASAYITKSIGDWAEGIGAKSFWNMSLESIEEALYDEVKSIHEQLIAIAQKSSLSYGSTLTLLLIVENSYIVIQVGDSRCYLLQDQNIRQITRDQTLAERMRQLGEGDSTGKKEESTLLQCIGQGEMQPSIYDGILSDGFQFLLCTDGLSNSLGHRELSKELTAAKPEKAKLEELLNKARQNGEDDNITAILIRQNALR